MKPTAVLGGTGPFGRALALRLAGNGVRVVIGSRSAERARQAASVPGVAGTTNREAAEIGDPVYLAVPFEAQEALLAEVGAALDGKLVICCAVIWPPGSQTAVSAAEEAARLLPKARVAAAFQTVAAGALAEGDSAMDVLVFADKDDDRDAAVQAAGRSGLRAVSAGPLRLSRVAEAALAILLRLNRSGRARRAGIRITGLEGDRE